MSRKVEAVRERLPPTRTGLNHKFSIRTMLSNETVTGYIIANTYEDGRVAEVFCRMDKEGSIVGGLMDALTVVISVALQYGVPLRVICDKLSYMKFEPAGWIDEGDKDLHQASSVVDYLGRWLAKTFLPAENK